MALPLLGGSPSVWTTCVVFYQVILLLGYLYSHLIATRLPLKGQVTVHAVVLMLPFLVLPLSVPDGFMLGPNSSPVMELFKILFLWVALPLFAVSTNSPLLQKWFSSSKSRLIQDPYSLYVASNLGSVVALLSYPFLLEPVLRLNEQSRIWALLYGGVVALVLVCGMRLVLHRSSGEPVQTPSSSRPVVGWPKRLRWIALSFVPSSLMLGVTAFLSMDIAPIPFFWVVPLALYLLSFVLTFAQKPWIPHELMVRAMPILAVPLMLLMMNDALNPPWLIILFHLVTFFVAAMVCHGELFRSRPEVSHLTEFYLWLSVGGALGGSFNAVIAPIVFNRLSEYPLALALAALLRPPPDAENTRRKRVFDVVWPVVVGALSWGLLWGLSQIKGLPAHVNIKMGLAVPALISFFFSNRSLRFGLAIAALFLVNHWWQDQKRPILFEDRSFFGVHRVFHDQRRNIYWLRHGNIIHGGQSQDPARVREPLTYYHPTGPIGDVFRLLNRRTPEARVGVVGLGAGSLASFGLKGQRWTFFEIDPLIKELALQKNLFHFLHMSPARIDVVMGDARLTLSKTEPHSFDLLVIDAFGSDAVPSHLITKEALALYLGKLKPEGVLAFHISNRYVDFKPLLSDAAHEAGLFGFIGEDQNVSAAEKDLGKFVSTWMVLSKEAKALAGLHENRLLWKPLLERSHRPLFQDDRSSLWPYISLR